MSSKSWRAFALLAGTALLPTVLLTSGMRSELRYASWAETARALSTSLIVILPIVTLAVLFLAAGQTPRGVVGAVLAGWLLGAGPALFWTIRTAGDAPPLLFLLVPIAWLAAVATTAALLVRAVRRRTAIVAAGIFWLIVIGADLSTGRDSRWLSLLPFSGMSGQPSGEVALNSWLAGVRLFVAAAMVVAAAFLAYPNRRTAGWAAVGVIVASIAFPVPVYASAAPQVACLDGRPRVCLLTEHRSDLPAVKAMVDRVAAAAGPELFPFTLASETAVNGPTAVQLAVGPERTGSLARDVAGELAGKVARIDRCAPTPGQHVDPAYRLVAFWFVERMGLPLDDFARDPELEPRLAAWRRHPAEVTAALRTLTGRLDACTLTAGELPAGPPATG
ncbi:hypothetical protein PWY87_29230 [Kribbella solani]|uniref:hypothetical protein n=1 Tax=Kribbella solani TaxID=236067 RepID=UPI0029A16E47|nr:hypothetical protein [Kribbella solani]MDX3005797.1 hypothetical protein [Kribbella solani]